MICLEKPIFGLFESGCFTQVLLLSDQHDILVLITYAQQAPINDNAEIPSGIRGLNFGPSLHIHTLRIRADTPEHSLLDNAISPKIYYM